LAQAHRIKTQPSVIRVNILRFFNRALREIAFWLLVVVALGMIVALATFNPSDPAWTHTVEVAQLHNLGGAAGAWFADVMLYLLGYPAYLLPLGVTFAGWRLFKRGALLELDAEVVLFRVLGFAVALATACGLVALHLRVFPNTVPGDGTAGGLVGVHVSQFLVQAFGATVGNLFMIALLLAGLTLMTGISWLTMMDWIGRGTLWMLDAVGGLVMAPLRWLTGSATGIRRSRPAEPGDQQGEEGSREQIDSVNPAGNSVIAAAVDQAAVDQMEPPSVAGDSLKASDSIPPIAEEGASQLTIKPVAMQSLANGAVRGAATGGGRHSARIEPVFDLSSQSPQSPTLQAAAVAKPIEEPVSEWAMSDLTLVPVANSSAHSPPARDEEPTVGALLDTPTFPAEPIAPTAPTPPQPAAPVAPTPPQPAAPVAPTPPQPAAPVAPVATMIRRSAAPRPVAVSPLPPLDLLDPPPRRTAGYASELLDEMSRRLESLLKSFGIDVQVVAVEPGPVITRFEIEPAPGVKVSQISNLVKDLARGLSVISVRVVEIIPGKSVIGLEIPNRQRQTVYLRETLESLAYAQSSAPLTLVLGQDIGGKPVVANLNKMPHLLVAGTTGSGKSVGINTMLLSLLYKAPPSDVRLILVDPKMLELSVYEDIPHLLTPVVTDMQEAANALRWCVGEMERRYRLMAALKVRNIAGFNRKVRDALATGEGLADPFWTPDSAETPGEVAVLQPLPFIVVVIDELADMMVLVGKKVEELIARLAQKARAAGIHLILATQRPSVDVITGLIKANIPTRIAFQVSSRVDSRTILDQIGAEQLLGHGDLLYLPPGTGLPQRVHGAFVDDHEVNRVVEYLRQAGAPDYVDEVLAEAHGEGDNGGGSDDGGGRGESDPLYDQAVQIVVESRRASVSGVQRRLRIGYNRAARLVEEMEVAGIVTPVQPNGSREVLTPPH